MNNHKCGDYGGGSLYLAFGLMVTVVWLYISILKLLALLSRNR